MFDKSWSGHLMALLSILIWGTTFVSTKVLQQSFAPLEIIVLRVSIAWLALLLVCPHRLRLAERRQEWLFAGAGLSGVTLYFLAENTALTYTYASNVGVIIAVAPFFTALFAHFLLREEKLRPLFFVGFVFAIAGVALLSFNGSALQLNPLGDLLALLAVMAWAVYSVLLRKISSLGYPPVQTTRRIFFYGLLGFIPAGFALGFRPDLARLAEPVNLLNLAYLGLGASALCFVTWNLAVRRLGAIKTTAYLYAVPVVTLIASVVFLRETITPLALAGTALTLVGLVLSECRPPARRKQKPL